MIQVRLMQHIYYIEVNLICLVLLGIINGQISQTRAITSTRQRALRRMVISTAILCLSDIVAGVCRGMFFPGARAVIQLSNLLYLEMMPAISMYWLIYTLNKIGKTPNRSQSVLIHLPLVLFTLVAVVNPFSRFLFSINEQNLYTRGPGVFLHWIISWSYLLYAAGMTVTALRKNANAVVRTELMPLLYFLVLPIIGCATQMIFYGVTSVQAGITLSIVLVSLKMQENKILSDELTGINNRKALNYYIDSLVSKGTATDMMVMMIDVNQFKKINDSFGHAVGDMALCDTADVLRRVCRKTASHLFLCRFGGDEFVIVGKNMNNTEMEGVISTIRKEAASFDPDHAKPYTLEFSIGSVIGNLEQVSDFDRCMRLADEVMYADKKRLKAIR